jgi:hypothetical protein
MGHRRYSPLMGKFTKIRRMGTGLLLIKTGISLSTMLRLSKENLWAVSVVM